MRRNWQWGRRIALGSVAALVYTFLLGPILTIIIASFENIQSYNFNFPPRELSLHWYFEIPAKYYRSLVVSLVVASVTATLAVVLGSMTALALTKGRIIGRLAIEEFFRLPVQIPFVVTAVAFLQFYNEVAVFSGLDLLGTLPGLIIAHVFLTMPYGVATVLVMLSRLPPQLERAAQSLGATDWSCFWRVILPTIKPGLFAGFFYAFIISFGDVPVSLFLSGGSDLMPVPVQIFQTLQFDFDPTVLALSSLLVVFSALLIVTVQRLVGLDLVLPSRR